MCYVYKSTLIHLTKYYHKGGLYIRYHSVMAMITFFRAHCVCMCNTVPVYCLGFLHWAGVI